MLWLKTYVAGSTPMASKNFFYNLVMMYWTFSIYMQFEYQYPKSSNVSVENGQLLWGMFGFFEPREMLRSFVARRCIFEISVKPVHAPRGKLNV